MVPWLLGNLNLWPYVRGALELPTPILLQLYGADTLAFAAGVLLYRALLRRGAWWSAMLAFPAARVAFELLLDFFTPHGTAQSLAYTQLGLPPFLQLASLTGPWGMTFLLLMFPAALATGWQLRHWRGRAWRVVGVGVGVVAAALVFGAGRLARSPSGPTMKVGIVASDGSARGGAPTAALIDEYASRAVALAGQGAQAIVFPEGFGVTVDPAATKDADARLQALAEQTQAVIVAGLIRVAPSVKYNEARLYAPGTPVRRYHKQHLLPPGELQFTPGHALVTVPRTTGTWGVAICKDMDFTPLSRAYGRAGVGLMLVPASDFVVDGLWHGHMAVMRGVESGFSVVRAARNGYLMVSDDRGRILAETASGSAPFATLLADVPATHDATLYLRLGDWFPWFALVVLGVAIVRVIRESVVGRRARRTPREGRQRR